MNCEIRHKGQFEALTWSWFSVYWRLGCHLPTWHLHNQEQSERKLTLCVLTFFGIYQNGSVFFPNNLIERAEVINSLAPGKLEQNFRYVIFKRILVIIWLRHLCEIALIWMSLDFTDDQSTLVQVMVWCRQATRHYLNQCWPRSLQHMASLGHNEINSILIDNKSLPTN